MNYCILKFLLNPAVTNVCKRPAARIEIQEEEPRPVVVRTGNAKISSGGCRGAAERWSIVQSYVVDAEADVIEERWAEGMTPIKVIILNRSVGEPIADQRE